MHVRPTIILLCSLFFACTGYAQIGLQFSDQLIPDITDQKVVATLTAGNPPGPPVLRSIFLPDTSPHALFCRLEWNLEKEVNIPFRFRLGSVDYVDWLEGKRRRFE